MPFGSENTEENTTKIFDTEEIKRIIQENKKENEKYTCTKFLKKYRKLVKKYNFILTTTATPFKLVVSPIDRIIEKNKGGNNYNNYHEPLAPENKEDILKEILNIPLRKE